MAFHHRILRYIFNIFPPAFIVIPKVLLHRTNSSFSPLCKKLYPVKPESMHQFNHLIMYEKHSQQKRSHSTLLRAI
jgi:hypothetical protein